MKQYWFVLKRLLDAVPERTRQTLLPLEDEVSAGRVEPQLCCRATASVTPEHQQRAAAAEHPTLDPGQRNRSGAIERECHPFRRPGYIDDHVGAAPGPFVLAR